MNKLTLVRKVYETKNSQEVAVLTLQGDPATGISGDTIIELPAETAGLLLGKAYYLLSEDEYTPPAEEQSE